MRVPQPGRQRQLIGDVPIDLAEGGVAACLRIREGVGLEAGLIEMEQRMQTGRFKVDRNLKQWIDEYRMYHRVDGAVVPMNDDLLCSSRYGVMMLRYAMSYEVAAARPDKWKKSGRRGSWMSA